MSSAPNGLPVLTAKLRDRLFPPRLDTDRHAEGGKECFGSSTQYSCTGDRACSLTCSLFRAGETVVLGGRALRNGRGQLSTGTGASGAFPSPVRRPSPCGQYPSHVWHGPCHRQRCPETLLVGPTGHRAFPVRACGRSWLEVSRGSRGPTTGSHQSHSEPFQIHRGGRAPQRQALAVTYLLCVQGPGVPGNDGGTAPALQTRAMGKWIDGERTATVESVANPSDS